MAKSKTLFETFAGEHCEIVQDYEITTQLKMTEEGPTEIRVPMTVTGIVLDSDGEFLFLSSTGEEVDQAIPISSIKVIQIVPVSNPHDDQIDEFDPPEGAYN